MKNQHVYIAALLVNLVLTVNAWSQSELDAWAPQVSPLTLGQKVADRFIQSPHGVYGYGTVPHIPYFEVCTWYGALTFAKETGDQQLLKKLTQRFEPLFSTEAVLLPVPDHVDFTVFGSVPMELFMHTKDGRYQTLGLQYADKQWGPPEGPRVIPESHTFHEQGLTWQTRLWIDDMYMITLVQAQAYRVTGNTQYIDRAAKEMVFYLDKLQKPNGLFYHARDTPFFWGRGNGWMAAGMTELLRVLPKDHPNRAKIMEGYSKMMKTLLAHQTEDGAWRQLVDDPASWKESSCTGMFTFAMITGVKNGWLDKMEYGEAARKGWLAVVSFINERGEMREVCEGTGANNDRQYYFDRKRITGDMHGQAPALWCATALLRK